MVCRVLLQQPKEMAIKDINRPIAEFSFGAGIALEARFDGARLHGSHGCMPDMLFPFIDLTCRSCRSSYFQMYVVPRPTSSSNK